MPIISIDWVDSRTVEQKREIASRVTDVVVDVTGCAPETVTIIFSDHPRHDIAKAGALLSDK